MEYFPGSFFASAITSVSEFTGSDGFDSTIIGVVATVPIGAKSFSTS
jgi:hypothetical protein